MNQLKKKTFNHLFQLNSQFKILGLLFLAFVLRLVQYNQHILVRRLINLNYHHSTPKRIDIFC